MGTPPCGPARRPASGLLRALPALAAASLLLGCDGSSTEAEQDGLQATIVGDREGQFDGRARFAVEEGAFVLRATGRGASVGQHMDFVWGTDAIPEPGEYSIGSISPFGAFEADLGASWRMTVAVFGATAGTLTLTEVSDTRIVGAFYFNAVRTHACSSAGCDSLSGTQPVGHVAGSFTATPGPF